MQKKNLFKLLLEYFYTTSEYISLKELMPNKSGEPKTKIKDNYLHIKCRWSSSEF